MAQRYSSTQPYEQGMLAVGAGNLVYWEACGSPGGKPALVVHGGPGSGCSAGNRRYFDPERYRVVLFDQRGCGRSTPHASDPATDMTVNTTHELIADMERLREHLGIERWLLYGGSWGSTLILAVRRAASAARVGDRHHRRDHDSALRDRLALPGRGRFFPVEWERFRAGVPGARPRRGSRRGLRTPHGGSRSGRAGSGDAATGWRGKTR